jgi:DNA-binding response OmpR family regulator
MNVTSQEARGAEIYDDGYLYFEHDRFYLSFGGKPVYKLSTTDFKILSRLLRVPGQPVPAREIWQSARGGQAAYNSSSLRVLITYLRHKLSSYGVNIVHEAGSGYLLQISPPAKLESADSRPPHSVIS